VCAQVVLGAGASREPQPVGVEAGVFFPPMASSPRLFPLLPPTALPLLGHLAGAHLWRAARSVCDTVMGGASEARLRVPPGLCEEDGAVFEGVVRADGGGGFASVRAALDRADALAGGAARCDALLLHVRGDGRSYALRAFAAAGGAEVAYEARFATRRGECIEVFLPLRTLRARWRGMDVAGAPALRSVADVAEVGLMATKDAAGLGDFALECMGVYGAVEAERAQ
jgi:NADH dehydrogenase [ubiquinone] 1 alpha subcomplex assembly factor 1